MTSIRVRYLAKRMVVGTIWGVFLIAGLTSARSQETVESPPLGIPTIPTDSLPPSLPLTRTPVGFPGPPVSPDDNPLTEAKVRLGRRLFFDPILSRDGTVACATCHRPEHGFASPDPVAIGIGGRAGTRNSPSLINAAYNGNLTWDGRESTLESQVLGPLTNPNELGSEIEGILTRLNANEAYVTSFAEVFGDEAISETSLVRAIAAFERTLVSGNSSVDRFRHAEYPALSKAARQGMWLFESRGGCWKCHSGPNLTDNDFHNTGISWGIPDRDAGRMRVSNDPLDQYRFRTPSLRDIARTPPYMHDGSVASLREVVEYYNRGGNRNDPGLDQRLKPLGLSDQEVDFLVEYLRALSGDVVTADNEPK